MNRQIGAILLATASALGMLTIAQTPSRPDPEACEIVIRERIATSWRYEGAPKECAGLSEETLFRVTTRATGTMLGG